MAATRTDIARWLLDGLRNGATHVVIVCDTFDWDDFPVFVRPNQHVDDVVSGYQGRDGVRVMEVYDLNLNIQSQLEEERAFYIGQAKEA